MSLRPLSDAQQAMVRDNARLVTYALNRFLRRGGRPQGPDVDADDLRAVASLALCRAAALYDPARGKFSSYAVRAILLSIYRACNPGENRKYKPPPVISIETRATGTDPDCRLSDVLGSGEDGPEARALFAETLREYEAAIRKLNQSGRDAMDSILSGETSGEYARRLGFCRQAGEQRRKRARNALRQALEP